MREPNKIGAELRAWAKKHRLSETALVEQISAANKGFSVSQSWLSRIMAGQFRRLTPAIKVITSYANIPLLEETRHDPSGKELIDQALSSTWNGSKAHALVIARLIKVADTIPLAAHEVVPSRRAEPQRRKRR